MKIRIKSSILMMILIQKPKNISNLMPHTLNSTKKVIKHLEVKVKV